MANVHDKVTYLEKRLAYLESRIAKLLPSQLVDETTYGTTLDISRQMRFAYDTINEKIARAKKEGNTLAIATLIEAKKLVPLDFKVSIGDKEAIMTWLNNAIKQILEKRKELD